MLQPKLAGRSGMGLGGLPCHEKLGSKFVRSESPYIIINLFTNLSQVLRSSYSENTEIFTTKQK